MHVIGYCFREGTTSPVAGTREAPGHPTTLPSYTRKTLVLSHDNPLDNIGPCYHFEEHLTTLHYL
jgi:hypothetical protein